MADIARLVAHGDMNTDKLTTGMKAFYREFASLVEEASENFLGIALYA